MRQIEAKAQWHSFRFVSCVLALHRYNFLMVGKHVITRSKFKGNINYFMCFEFLKLCRLRVLLQITGDTRFKHALFENNQYIIYQ